jgi:hypothetical protein
MVGVKVLAIVHKDGHAVGVAGGGVTRAWIERTFRGMSVAANAADFRLEELETGKAVAAHINSLRCMTCRIVLSCGCIPEHLIWCDHGTAAKIEEAARREG